MNSLADTIVAISTPPGHSGIGVVRVSGPEAVVCLARVFEPTGSVSDFPDRTAVYGKVKDPESGTVLDDGIALVMRGPASYTGEDVVELSVHGSPVVLNMVLRLLVSAGCRPAGRGEFTRRAFLSGKLDLVQAEAVIDLIEATGPTAVYEARSRMDRSLSRTVQEISSKIKDVLAELEAHLDFDEDEEEPAPEPAPSLRDILSRMDGLIRHAGTGRIRREGVKVAIVGKPNVGKSTLFNALLRTDRAIVTPHAGTTRDSLEERVVLSGASFVLWDTAGIRDNPESVEEEGIRRTRGRIGEADMVVAVMDGSSPLDHEDAEVLKACGEKTTLVVLNKGDLAPALSLDSKDLGPDVRQRIRLSAITRDGLDELEEVLGRVGQSLTAIPGRRQAGSLTRRGLLLVEAARAPLNALLDRLDAGGHLEQEIISLELRRSLGCLEEITGERADDGILERIFERFCVGK